VWADGAQLTVRAQSDGTFIAVHDGSVRSLSVAMLNAAGGIIRQVAGP
jgi:hypothetical protein